MRVYTTLAQIERMVARTAFTQLRYSAWLLAATVAGLALTYFVAPVVALTAPAPAAILGAVAWLLMCASYYPAVRFYRQSFLWAPLLPLIAAFYMWATLHSAIRYWRGSGGQWKGRSQAH